MSELGRDLRQLMTNNILQRLYLAQQKNLFQDVAGKERISNVAYHSWRKKKKWRWLYLLQLCDVTTNTDIPPPLSQSLTVCQSVAAGLYVSCAAGTGSSGGSEVWHGSSLPAGLIQESGRLLWTFPLWKHKREMRRRKERLWWDLEEDKRLQIQYEGKQDVANGDERDAYWGWIILTWHVDSLFL